MERLKICNHPKIKSSQICATCEAPKEWESLAQCLLVEPDLLFPEETELDRVLYAKKICSNCPVKGFCLELGWYEPYGIWGGYTSLERKRLRKTFSLKDKSKSERRDTIRTIAYRFQRSKNGTT